MTDHDRRLLLAMSDALWHLMCSVKVEPSNWKQGAPFGDSWSRLIDARNEYKEHFFPEGGIVGEETKADVSHEDGGSEV